VGSQSYEDRLFEFRGTAPNVLTGQDREVIGELYRTLVPLGAESDLLATVGVGETACQIHEVLACLRTWNKGQLERIKERIGHYEVSGLQSGYSPDVPQGISA
jgi:hypothetical protein